LEDSNVVYAENDPARDTAQGDCQLTNAEPARPWVIFSRSVRPAVIAPPVESVPKRQGGRHSTDPAPREITAPTAERWRGPIQCSAPGASAGRISLEPLCEAAAERSSASAAAAKPLLTKPSGRHTRGLFRSTFTSRKLKLNRSVYHAATPEAEKGQRLT
jgi:hypothetical protein